MPAGALDGRRRCWFSMCRSPWSGTRVHATSAGALQRVLRAAAGGGCSIWRGRGCGARQRSTPRTCGRYRVAQLAAWPHSSPGDTHPGDTANPSNALSTRRARVSGRKCAHVSHAARALTPGPYWTRPAAPPGALASVAVPHPPQVRDCTRCSVTYRRCGRPGEGRDHPLMANTAATHPPPVFVVVAAPPVNGGMSVIVFIGIIDQTTVWPGGTRAPYLGSTNASVPALRRRASSMNGQLLDDRGLPLLDLI